MRSSDPKNLTKRFFRSGARTFQLNDGWYFATREGERGPFRSRQHADAEAQRYVQDLHQLRGFQASRSPSARKSETHLRNRQLEKLSERAAPRVELTLEAL